MINGHSPNETSTLTELLLGRQGFKCCWTYREGVGAAFACWQIVGRQSDGLKLPLFLAAEQVADSEEPILTPDHTLAAPYLNGAIKADGRVWIKSDSVFHGTVAMKRHLELQKVVYERAYRLMKARQDMPWKEA